MNFILRALFEIAFEKLKSDCEKLKINFSVS